jgi:predicted nucleotidyltransferase
MLKELLRVRTTERRWLLQQIRDALEDDQRVRAAWLEGSLARGTPDALSDLDVAVVVSDAAMSTVAGGPSRPVDYRKVLDSPRGRWVSDLAEPLLLLEAPQNAPLGGAFLTSLFAGEAGPQQVDWTWLPWATARRPAESLLLFDRDGHPGEAPRHQIGNSVTMSEPTPLEVASHAVPWFWATLIWNAKHVARSRASAPMPLLDSTIGAISDLEGFLDQESRSPRVVGDPSGVDGIPLLAELADRMDRLRPRGPSLFGDIPSDVSIQARRFLRLADAMSHRAG